jgi:hypothetical protein
MTENAVAVGTEPVMRVKRTKSDGLRTPHGLSFARKTSSALKIV